MKTDCSVLNGNHRNYYLCLFWSYFSISTSHVQCQVPILCYQLTVLRLPAFLTLFHPSEESFSEFQELSPRTLFLCWSCLWRFLQGKMKWLLAAGGRRKSTVCDEGCGTLLDWKRGQKQCSSLDFSTWGIPPPACKRRFPLLSLWSWRAETQLFDSFFPSDMQSYLPMLSLHRIPYVYTLLTLRGRRLSVVIFENLQKVINWKIDISNLFVVFLLICCQKILLESDWKIRLP